MLRNFLNNLGVRMCELIESIRCFAANLADTCSAHRWILGGLSERLSPGRILELIKCAIEGAISGARSIGASLASHMMEFFEGPDDAIGLALGRLTGSTLVQVVITYFAAGAGAAVGIVQKISQALGAVGRALGAVVKLLQGLLGKLVGFLKGFASKFAGAAARGTRSVLGKVGGLFKKVAAWFGKLFRKIFKGFRKRFGLTPAQRRQWRAFKRAAHGIVSRHRGEGVSKRQLASEFRSVVSSHSQVAKWPSFITRKRARWKLWARKVKSLAPTGLGMVLIDRVTRWKRGVKDVKKKLKKVKGRDTNVARLDALLRPIKRKWEFKALYARPDAAEKDFNIMAHMSPDQQIAEVDDLSGLHDGSHGDPIPIHWYKPPAAYHSIQIKLSRDATTKTTVAPTTVTTVTNRGETHRIGVTHHPIGTGDLLHRSKTTRGGGAGRFNTLMAALDKDMRGQDADHVKDLAFGGPVAFNNLWPLDTDINQRASTRGQWYSSYRLRSSIARPACPRKREADHQPARQVLKVIGMTYQPAPNPGGRDSG